MKITFVLPPLNMSGGIRVIAIYADRLHRRGHEVMVVHPPNRPIGIRERLRSVVNGRGWPESRRRSSSHFDGVDVATCMLDEYRAVVDADLPDADIVVATWWETADWVATLSKAKGAKAYFMQDYGACGQPLEELQRTWKLPFHIITISNWLVDLVEEHSGTKPSLVLNAVEADLFRLPARSMPTVPQVGFTYTASPQKGIDVCISAIELARQRVPELRVICFGSERPGANLPLPSDTTFGYRVRDAELKRYYGECTAWLFGSRREGFGLPILEAMACGTPVIATPAGAAPELVTDARGRLVPVDDPEAMAEAIVSLCGMSSEAWKHLSAAAYDCATGYTWDDAMDRFEEALQIALS